MPLYEHEIARMTLRGCAPEVIEADLVERRGGGVGGDVAAVLTRQAIGLYDHRHGVPANVGFEPPLERAIARILMLESRRNRVHVSGVRFEGQIGAGAARVIDQ